MPINHPSEISEIFDEISYYKGSSVIRMMANFLGVHVFNKGIEEYLKKYKYQNTQQVINYQQKTENKININKNEYLLTNMFSYL